MYSCHCCHGHIDCRDGTHVMFGPQQPDDADMGVCSSNDISIGLVVDVGCTSVGSDAMPLAGLSPIRAPPEDYESNS